MRWNLEPLYPWARPLFLLSPVQNWRKFSAVLGTTSLKSSKVIRPRGSPVRVSLWFDEDTPGGLTSDGDVEEDPAQESAKMSGPQAIDFFCRRERAEHTEGKPMGELTGGSPSLGAASAAWQQSQ